MVKIKKQNLENMSLIKEVNKIWKWHLTHFPFKIFSFILWVVWIRISSAIKKWSKEEQIITFDWQKRGHLKSQFWKHIFPLKAKQSPFVFRVSNGSHSVSICRYRAASRVKNIFCICNLQLFCITGQLLFKICMAGQLYRTTAS